MGNLNPDRLNNAQAEAVVTAVNGTTAALLQLDQTLQRLLGRP
jgi:hypothetical protein